MKLTRLERKRLLMYKQTIEDVDGDLSVLTKREWADYQNLRLKIGEHCPHCGCDIAVWNEVIGGHNCFEEV